MAAITVGLNNGVVIPFQLQLLLLKYLSSTLNVSEIATLYNTDITDSKQSFTISIDKDIFNNEASEKVIVSLENNIKEVIQQFKTAVVLEVKKTSFKSDELLSYILRNITDTVMMYEKMSENSNKENVKQSNRNKELEDKLLNITQDAVSTQHDCAKESSKIYNTIQELQLMLGNTVKRNEKQEETTVTMLNNITSLHEEIFKLIENNQQLLAGMTVKDKRIQQLEASVKETTDKNHQLNDDLNKVTAKYTKIQQFFGLTDQQQNYCRISQNSVLWKFAHTQPQAQTPAGAFIWTPTHAEIGAGRMQILYSSSRDKYIRGVGKEEMNGWDKGIYEHNSMFRMVEKDFKMAYLAREVGTTEGTISWKFDLTDSGTSVDIIKIKFSTSLFHNGKVEAKICTFSECLDLPTGDKVYETSNFQGVPQLVIRAKTTLGVSAPAWQHAQLFRQPLSDMTGYGFDVTINLKRCDVLAL